MSLSTIRSTVLNAPADLVGGRRLARLELQANVGRRPWHSARTRSGAAFEGRGLRCAGRRHGCRRGSGPARPCRRAGCRRAAWRTPIAPGLRRCPRPERPGCAPRRRARRSPACGSSQLGVLLHAGDGVDRLHLRAVRDRRWRATASACAPARARRPACCGNVRSTPACLPVVRIFERKRKSSTATRIMRLRILRAAERTTQPTLEALALVPPRSLR